MMHLLSLYGDDGELMNRIKCHPMSKNNRELQINRPEIPLQILMFPNWCVIYVMSGEKKKKGV